MKKIKLLAVMFSLWAPSLFASSPFQECLESAFDVYEMLKEEANSAYAKDLLVCESLASDEEQVKCLEDAEAKKNNAMLKASHVLALLKKDCFRY